MALRTLLFALLLSAVTGLHRAIQYRQVSLARIGVQLQRFYMAEGGKEEDSEPNRNRPPIIPFDFVRDDIKLPTPEVSTVERKNKEIVSKNMREAERMKASKEVIEATTRIQNDNARPTGYDTPDEDEEEDSDDRRKEREEFYAMLDRNNSDKPDVVAKISRFFQDTYVGTPYDSKKQQQARYVVKNITAISLAIGFVFTFVWYAFPGKFISYRGDTDLTSRYQSQFVDPDDLLKSDTPSSLDPQYFDNGVGVPQQEQTRFSPDNDVPAQPRAPGKSELF